MSRTSLKTATIPFFGLLLLFTPLGCGSDGSAGPPGPRGPNGDPAINASTTPDSVLRELDIVSEITSVTIASPPVVNFTVKTAEGVPIIGLIPFWNDSSRFIRFTITKLVPGQNGDPNTWVAYVRDATSGEPDYDTGASLVENADGSYTFTFNTDVTNVTGVPYEATLTHRVAGQIGRFSTVAIEEQNVWLDFVPNGSAVTTSRKIATVASCNECHNTLVFHGRRFEVEYCVQCHNPDLAQGEGNFAFMIHRIHNAGKFTILDGGVDYDHVTYPQDVINCRKCHNVDDTATPQADNWRNLPNMAACDGCHDVFNANAMNMHSGGVQTDNAGCVGCHSAASIVEFHTTPNSTPNNPELLPGERNIQYELIDAVVNATTNDVTIKFKILSDGTALDVTNLPAEFKDGAGAAFRYPGFLLAYAQAQDGITAPADYNNLGRNAGQPLSLTLGNFSPIQATNPIGTLTFNSVDGVMTATVTATASQFPVGATLRAVGLQGYLRQDLDNDGSYDVSLHTTSAVVPVTGDAVRRDIVDATKCSQCHEIFEGHGGNRVFSAGSAVVCVMCHVPNLSTSSRTVDPLTASAAVIAAYGTNPLVYPEDTNNFRDMIHGIHSSGFRTKDYEFVRNRSNGIPYNWSHVTFPRGATTNNCLTCHKPGTYELPLNANILPVTVRTTGVVNGQDVDRAAVLAARAAVPNATDWVNSPTGSACYYCHTSDDAWAHMTQNGAQLSLPALGAANYVNRSSIGGRETCVVCHGPGRIGDLNVVHNK